MKRTVLITGGSSGIGAAMVREFAARDYRVWYTYHEGEDRARDLAAALQGAEVTPFHLELGNRESTSTSTTSPSSFPPSRRSS